MSFATAVFVGAAAVGAILIVSVEELGVFNELLLFLAVIPVVCFETQALQLGAFATYHCVLAYCLDIP